MWKILNENQRQPPMAAEIEEREPLTKTHFWRSATIFFTLTSAAIKGFGRLTSALQRLRFFRDICYDFACKPDQSPIKTSVGNFTHQSVKRPFNREEIVQRFQALPLP